MSTIAFDIEVAGFPWEDVDEATRDYLVGRERDSRSREAVPERLALYPGLGKVIAIGMWHVEEQRGTILLEGDDSEEQPWDQVPSSTILRGNEKRLLEKFWEMTASESLRLVSYNGRGYDGPVLTVRSAQHGIAPSRHLVGPRYDMTKHCDLMEVFSFQGAMRKNYSLDYWCRRFDVDSPKGGIDGSQVGRVYAEGGIDEIGEYCLRDVRATAELYSKVESTMLPLFLRGK